MESKYSSAEGGRAGKNSISNDSSSLSKWYKDTEADLTKLQWSLSNFFTDSSKVNCKLWITKFLLDWMKIPTHSWRAESEINSERNYDRKFDKFP